MPNDSAKRGVANEEVVISKGFPSNSVPISSLILFSSKEILFAVHFLSLNSIVKVKHQRLQTVHNGKQFDKCGRQKWLKMTETKIDFMKNTKEIYEERVVCTFAFITALI